MPRYQPHLQAATNPFSNITLIAVDEIQNGLNQDKGIQVALVAPLPRFHDNVARSFVGIDQKGILICVSVYNVRHDLLKPGSVLTIAHPYVSPLESQWVICADEPLFLAIDGKVDTNAIQWTQIKVNNNEQ